MQFKLVDWKIFSSIKINLNEHFLKGKHSEECARENRIQQNG